MKKKVFIIILSLLLVFCFVDICPMAQEECLDPNIDTDADGIPDCEDWCPTDPHSFTPGDFGWGCGDPYHEVPDVPDCPLDDTLDADGDGVNNCLDLCPYDYNKQDLGACGCGVPDTPGCKNCCADPNEIVCEPGTDPNYPEICDGIDNNCNQEVDEGFNIGQDCNVVVPGCKVAVSGKYECSDTDPTKSICVPDYYTDPNAKELCDGIDNNCDGNTDEGFDIDTACMVLVPECTIEVEGRRTCSWDDPNITICVPLMYPDPNAEELCDGIDNNCDGNIDEGVCDGVDTQSIELIPGWNWVSFNVLPDDTSLESFFGDHANLIEQVKTQTRSATNVPGIGWMGDDLNLLSNISNGVMFKIKTKAETPFTLSVTGMRVPTNMTIELQLNWTWIAYLPGPACLSVEDVVLSIVDVDDFYQIKSQNASKTNIGGTPPNLVGDLTDMCPGKGYVVKMNAPGSLTYPTPL